MMLTSASCCRHVQQDSACSIPVRQGSDISTQGTAPVYVIDMSEEQINIKIVQAIKKFPVIYDYLSPGHSNKDEVDKAWHAVSKEVNIDVNSCKEKWRNCRNCWARYLRQTPVSGSAARPKKPYYLAEYLAFLTPFTKSRRQLGSMEIPATTKELSPKIEEGPVSPATTEVQNVSDHEEMQPVPPPREIRKKRERSKADIDEVFISYLETKAKRVPGEESDNPDLCFFKSLLPDVAKLTPAQKSAFKLFLQQNLHDMLYSSSADFHNTSNVNQAGPSTSLYQYLNVNQSDTSSDSCTPLPSPHDEA